MNVNSNGKLPVDDQGVEDVTEADWASGGLPDRSFERIAADPAAQEALNAVLAEMRQHQQTLSQVRKAKQLAQSTIAELLEIDQSEVSRLERRSDMLLSALRSFIQAAGGGLQLAASFPDSEPVLLLVGRDR